MTYQNTVLSYEQLFITGFCRLTNSVLNTDTGVEMQNHQHLAISEWFRHIYRESDIQYPKFHKMDLLCKGAFLAAEWLIKAKPLLNDQVPLIFANRTGSMFSDLRHDQAINESGLDAASPANFVYTLPNIALGEISIRHELHSKNVFFIFDQFGDENWLEYIRMCFHEQGVSQVLAGWVEVTEEDTDILLVMIEKNTRGQAFCKEELELLYK